MGVKSHSVEPWLLIFGKLIGWTQIANLWKLGCAPSNCKQLISQPSIAPLYEINRIDDPRATNPRGRAPFEIDCHRKDISGILRQAEGSDTGIKSQTVYMSNFESTRDGPAHARILHRITAA